ncbi:MAG: rhodanese-like domain-containing protein [Granulosicoccus sp.]
MSDTPVINLSGYRFTPLADPESLQLTLKSSLTATGVKGAVLLASEGINITLAGTRGQTDAAIDCLEQYESLQGIWLKETVSSFVPHKRLRVRVRAEIIAFDGDEPVGGAHARPDAPVIQPDELDAWLAENRPFTLLDTRNDYEIVSGTFKQATHLDIKHFRHFKEAIAVALTQGRLDKSQPVVTFCTGGIRCEKAAPWLLAEGFTEVYQIEGGLINYLQLSDSSHWQGDCFVFDDRVELTRTLEPSGAGLCDYCQLAVPAGTQCQCQLGPHYHATYKLS